MPTTSKRESSSPATLPGAVVAACLITLAVIWLPGLVFWWDFGWIPTANAGLRPGTVTSPQLLLLLVARALQVLATIVLWRNRGALPPAKPWTLWAVVGGLLPYVLTLGLVFARMWRARHPAFGALLGVADVATTLGIVAMLRPEATARGLSGSILLGGLTAPLAWYLLLWNELGQRIVDGRIYIVQRIRAPALKPVAWLVLLFIATAFVASIRAAGRRAPAAEGGPSPGPSPTSKRPRSPKRRRKSRPSAQSQA